MRHLPTATPSRTLGVALAISLLAHVLVLLIQFQKPESVAPPRLEARLAPPAPNTPQAELRPALPPKPTPKSTPKSTKTPRPAPAPRILTARTPSTTTARVAESTPKWSVAQKEEMNNFLDELASDAKARQAKPKPDLAERSLAMAREHTREALRGDSRNRRDALADLIERIPDSPPVDPFSLEFYLDSLVKKLNRSASFVKNDPRARGIQSAAIEVRLNPNGSLKSFVVTRSGDQQEEIAFVKSVVERAVPFAAFPPDITKSARSLALVICIQPASLESGGFGFTRKPEGSRC
ncbi:MAG: hypothetical protein IPQ01_10620 [Zoogloea sp.]|nr:hypothetical protein [Zoogloea sp.]